MGETRDARARAMADLPLAASVGGDELAATVRAAFVAGVEPFEIAELSGLEMPKVWGLLGMPPTTTT